MGKNLYYGVLRILKKSIYPAPLKSKNNDEKIDEDLWSLAFVQKLNCDSETIIIIFPIFPPFLGGVSP